MEDLDSGATICLPTAPHVQLSVFQLWPPIDKACACLD